MPFALGPKAEAAGYRLAAYETIGSTSTEAMERARAGDPGRLWIVSKAQTAGHGRRGRAWQTPSGNLAASLLLRLSSPPAQNATLGFVAGLVVEHAIRSSARTSSPFWGEAESERSSEPGLRRAEAASAAQAGEGAALDTETQTPHPLGLRRVGPSLNGRGGEVRLKWPNDVLIDGSKVSGILLQGVNAAAGPGGVVIGIGINVLHTPEGLPYPATSLAACGAPIDAEDLFEALAEAWVEQEASWNGGRGFDVVRQRWLERAAGLGAPIAVRSGHDVVRGIFETIDETGMLVIRAPDGTARKIAAGEVHFGAAATMGAFADAS